MKLKLLFGFLVAAIIAALALYEPPAEPSNLTHRHLVYDLEIDFDSGDDIGSIFQLVDRRGVSHMAAGFKNGFQTGRAVDNRNLSFYVRDPSAEVSLQANILPAPYPDALLKSLYITSFGDQLVAFFPLGEAPLTLSKEGWKPLKNPLGAKLLAVKRTRSGTLWMGKDEVYLNNKPYASFPRDGTSVLHYKNTLMHFAMNRDSNSQDVTYCEADLSKPVGKCRTATISGRRLYIAQPAEGGLLLFTNIGSMYYYDLAKGSFTSRMQTPPDVSNQFYAVANYYDKALYGHFPSGSLYEYRPRHRDSMMLSRSISSQDGTVNRAREAQALATYRGDLYVGIWPWGEVWKLSDRMRNVDMEYRAFHFPELSMETHPYQALLSKQEAVTFNELGQRVTTLIPLNGQLYVATAHKGNAVPAKALKEISRQGLQEYGRVHALSSPGQLTCPLPEKDKLRLEFMVQDSRMEVRADGEVLCTGEVPEALARSVIETRLERQERKGVWGAFGGTALRLVSEQ